MLKTIKIRIKLGVNIKFMMQLHPINQIFKYFTTHLCRSDYQWF
jgi:hypothetical protein